MPEVKAKPPRKRARRAMQRLTMNDVAAAAGVSASTVSLFLRRPEAVSPHLASRVRSVRYNGTPKRRARMPMPRV